MNTSKNTLLEAYHKIPTEAYGFICKAMGYAHKNSLINLLTAKRVCSVYKYEAIMSHYNYWKKYEAFTTSNKNGSYDIWQMRMYFKGLTTYINSPEMQLLSKNNKDKIIEEHKTIGKLIQTNQ